MVKTLRVRKVGRLEKIKGLIEKKAAEAILIKTRFGIHTFGVKFPIDVLVLDKEDRVRVIKETLKPNRVFVWPIKYDRVVELSEGEIKKEGIAVGEKIKLIL